MAQSSDRTRSRRFGTALAITSVVLLIAGVAAVVAARRDDTSGRADSGASPTAGSTTPGAAGPSAGSTAASGPAAVDVALLSLYQPRPPAAPRGRGGRVVAAAAAEPVSLDPFAVGGDTPATRELTPLWLPGLYRMGPGGVRTPWLAAGPPMVTPDGRRVVIELRPDARWSDGTAITSADVAATWQRAATRPGPWRAAYAALAGVETPSPTRAVLVLRAPGVQWARLFLAPTGVLPKARLAALGDRPYDLKVTGGPFVLAGRTPGLETTWRRTPAAWPGSDPHLDEVRVQVVPDFATAVALLEARKVDAVLPYDAINAEERVKRVPGVTTSADEQRRSVTVLTMRTTGGALKDVRVRRALALALDRPAFAEGLVRGGGTLADGVRVEERSAAPFVQARPDLAAARRLLDAAGWKDNGNRPRTKKGADLTLVLASPTPSDLYDVLARGLQVQLRKVGVQVDLAGADADKAAELARTAGADLAFTRWDTDVVSDLGRLLGSAGAAPAGAGWPRWSDPGADAALQQSAAAATLSSQDAPLDRLDARLASEAPLLPLLRLDPVTAAAPGVLVERPVSGYGGPLVDVDRWARAAPAP
ncbi:MAG TPA: ABC transporter substrate-binding protein [Mycobacteriales bacterium]|nr:ABC transporter substrate-binding protein [Mycobacteriales bacterium]